jgi:polysaccharide export outer membrane protein
MAGLLVGIVAVSGCSSAPTGGNTTLRGQEPEFSGNASARQDNVVFRASVPTEKAKTTLPTYTIEPPDILLVEAVKLVPKAPYHFEPLDTLQVNFPNGFPEAPLTGQYVIDPSGMIDLGPLYKGKVKVAGLASDKASEKINERLALLFDPEVIKEAPASVTLLSTAAQQQIAGEHVVGPDGCVTLGSYGQVYVAGMTVAEARDAVEERLSKFLQDPRVSVDIFAYNSKVYYIISEGAGFGDSVVRVPITGNETVLDALAQINGVTRFNSKKIWIARPAPGGVGCDQILPVNWDEIVKQGATATNYQIMPGDRVFLAEDKLVAFESKLGKITGPFEKMFGFTLLGVQTVQTIHRLPGGGGIQ